MNGAVTKLLSESRIFRNYTKAFRELSGLSLYLRPIEAAVLAHGGAVEWILSNRISEAENAKLRRILRRAPLPVTADRSQVYP